MRTVETVVKDLVVLLWEPQNNRFEEINKKDETIKHKKHFQDVYQTMKYCITNA